MTFHKVAADADAATGARLFFASAAIREKVGGDYEAMYYGCVA